jgi:hypothetical protein
MTQADLARKEIEQFEKQIRRRDPPVIAENDPASHEKQIA